MSAGATAHKSASAQQRNEEFMASMLVISKSRDVNPLSRETCFGVNRVQKQRTPCGRQCFRINDPFFKNTVTQVYGRAHLRLC
jgi:hypothetical protein